MAKVIEDENRQRLEDIGTAPRREIDQWGVKPEDNQLLNAVEFLEDEDED